MPETRPATGASALVVSTVATAAALGVLVVSSQIQAPRCFVWAA